MKQNKFMKKGILTTFDFDKALFPNANYHNRILSELQKGNYIKNCDFDKSLNLLTTLPEERLNKDAVKWLDNLFI
jgi:hypothetical protein